MNVDNISRIRELCKQSSSSKPKRASKTANDAANRTNKKSPSRQRPLALPPKLAQRANESLQVTDRVSMWHDFLNYNRMANLPAKSGDKLSSGERKYYNARKHLLPPRNLQSVSTTQARELIRGDMAAMTKFEIDCNDDQWKAERDGMTGKVTVAKIVEYLKEEMTSGFLLLPPSSVGERQVFLPGV